MLVVAAGEGQAPDPIKAFSNIIGKKIGEKDHGKAGSILTMISTFAILEFGQNVLNVGSGFTKLDLNGITITQIKETVKRIEEGVNSLIQEPLKSSKQYFEDALEKVSHSCNRSAEMDFKEVIKKARNAYNLIEKRNLSMKDFESCIEAMKLMIFSDIACNSYDESQEQPCFLPAVLLAPNKAKLIGDILKRRSTECSELKTKIKKSFTDSGERETAQNMLDKALTISYPYISESESWTNMRKKINSDDFELKIKVSPQYLPKGEEDCSIVAVGVNIEKRQVISMAIWKTGNYVISRCQGIISYEVIYSPTDLMEYDVFKNNGKELVLSSTGVTAERLGCLLGQYFYEPDCGCYVQTTTENKKVKAVFLLSKQHKWCVSMNETGTEPLLRNKKESKEPPLVGWQYQYTISTFRKQWKDDLELLVTPGPMESSCKTVHFRLVGDAAVKYPKMAGTYIRTDNWVSGRPVFQNQNGHFLYQQPNPSEKGNGWVIGPNFKEALIRGKKACDCPADENNWIFWNGFFSSWTETKITVDCSCKVCEVCKKSGKFGCTGCNQIYYCSFKCQVSHTRISKG